MKATPKLLNRFVVTLTLLALSYGLNAKAQDAKKETPTQAAVRLFNTTAALQNASLYPKASSKWAEFIQKFPTDERIDRVHYYLGICQLHTKEYAKAAATFQIVLTKYPKFVSLDGAHYNQAMAYFQLANASAKPEDFAKAALTFGAMATKFPKSRFADRALYFQGEAHFNAKQPEQAIGAYAKLTTTYPQSPLMADSLYALGTTQQDLAKYDDASATYRKFLANAAFAKHELGPEIHLRLGMSLYNAKKFVDAEKEFGITAAIPKYKLADFALLRQGQCRVEQGLNDKAPEVFLALISKFPESAYKAASQLAAGRAYYLSNNVVAAKTQLQAVAAAKSPESPEATYWLGRTLLKEKKPLEAFTVLDNGTKAFTQGDFVPYLTIARIDALYDIPERRKETAPLYLQFYQKNPKHQLAGQSLYMSALSNLGLEEYVNARTQAEQFLANPDFKDHELTPSVMHIAGEGYLLHVDPATEAANTTKAEALYRQLVTKFPEHAQAPQSHIRIGACLFKAKKFDAAVAYLTAQLAKLPMPEQKAQAQLFIGRSHSSATRHQPSATAFAAALAVAPKWERNDEVLLEGAQSYRALKDLANASKWLAQLNTQYAKSELRPHATYQLGEIAQEQKNYDQAITFYNQVVTTFPTSDFVVPANLQLGAAHFAKEDFPNALVALNKLIATAPTDTTKEDIANGRFLRGLVNHRTKKFPDAAADLTAFLATKPTGDRVFDAQFTIVLCQIGQKQFPQATVTLDALVKAKPDYMRIDTAYYELGHALLTEKKETEAIAAFQTLAAKRPDSPLVSESYFRIGSFHEAAAEVLKDKPQQLAKFALAETAYTAGVAKAKPGELKEKLQYKLGDVQFRQDKFPQASATLLAQIKEHPQGKLLGPTQYFAAECYFKTNDFVKAQPLFEQVAAAKTEKYWDMALFRAGDCAKRQNAWPISEKHFSALIAAFPAFEQINEARYGQAYAMHKQNKVAEAEKLYEFITTKTETETAAKARFMVGTIKFAAEKYDDAIVHFLEVATGYAYEEWQAQARFEAGKCMVQLKNTAKAKEYFQEIVTKHPEHALVTQAKKQIAGLQ